MPELIKVIFDTALAGDMTAAKIIVDRLYPALRPTGAEINIRTSGNLEMKGAAIVNAMTAGKMAPDTAKMALDAMALQARLTEQAELLARIEKLEAVSPAAKR